MQIRRITVQMNIFSETDSEFSVLSIFIFSFCPLIEVNFLFFVHFCNKKFVRCPLPGGVRSRDGRSY